MAPDAPTDHRVDILIVDDHEGISESLALALKAELGPTVRSTRAAPSIASAIAAVQRQRPDVVIMDVLLGEEDGIEAIDRIHAVDASIPVIIYTGMPDIELVAQANEAGAAAFLSKRAPLWRLAATVTTVTTSPPKKGSMLLASVSSPRRTLTDAPRLTDRQLEVLTLMRGGYDARSIAQQLGVSVNTARSHVKAILSKLEAHSQLEAVARAARLGLLQTR